MSDLLEKEDYDIKHQTLKKQYFTISDLNEKIKTLAKKSKIKSRER